MTGQGTPDDEDAVVRRITARFGDDPRLVVGPGHDCAVVDVDGARVVVTTDVLVDEVHFRLATCGGAAAGRKALLVNLSDLAAAGALPVAFEIGVVLPRNGARALADDVAAGLAEAAARYDVACAGGDTNVQDGPLVLALTALGRAGPANELATRAGARPGDVLSVTGPLGGSGLGRHLEFVPRLQEAQHLMGAGIVRAMMDLSDGLSRDLPRLCQASGVGATIDARRVPVHPDVARASGDRSPLEHALHDGEDFELLVAHPPLARDAAEELARAGVELHAVGEVVEAGDGIRLTTEAGTTPLPRRGFDHFTHG